MCCGESFLGVSENEVQSMPLILMGHGTEHAADVSYQKMEQILREYSNHAVYIATVEGRVTIDDVIGRMKVDKCVESGGEVMVMPFMLVAGEHANHDMAGEEGSFSSKLKEAGYQPKCMIRGIGEYAAVRDIYMEHLRRMTKIFPWQQTGRQNRNAIRNRCRTGKSKAYHTGSIRNDPFM